MGREIVYCEQCGDRILGSEFEAGKAITLMHKNYCARCMPEAIKGIDPKEVKRILEAQRKAKPTPAPKQAPKAPTKVIPEITERERLRLQAEYERKRKTVIFSLLFSLLAIILVLSFIMAISGEDDSNVMDTSDPIEKELWEKYEEAVKYAAEHPYNRNECISKFNKLIAEASHKGYPNVHRAAMQALQDYLNRSRSR
jgi:hypothetical protein